MKLENPWKQNPWFESVAVAQERARKRLPAPGVRRPGRRLRTRPDRRRQRGGLRRARRRPARRRPAGRARAWRTTVMGQEISLPVIISPHRRPGRAPRRRSRRRPGRRGARHRDGAVQLRVASRSRRSIATGATTFFQMYWTGDRDVMIQRMERAHAAGRHGPDRHPGLVVLDGPRLGQPRDPREGRPQDDDPDGAQGRHQAPLALRSSAAAGQIPDLTAPNLAPPGRRRADVLRAPTTSG